MLSSVYDPAKSTILPSLQSLKTPAKPIMLSRVFSPCRINNAVKCLQILQNQQNCLVFKVFKLLQNQQCCPVSSDPAKSTMLSSVFKPCKTNSAAQCLQTLQNQQCCPVSSNPAKPTVLSRIFNPWKKTTMLSKVFKPCTTNNAVHGLQNPQNQQHCPSLPANQQDCPVSLTHTNQDCYAVTSKPANQ